MPQCSSKDMYINDYAQTISNKLTITLGMPQESNFEPLFIIYIKNVKNINSVQIFVFL